MTHITKAVLDKTYNIFLKELLPPYRNAVVFSKDNPPMGIPDLMSFPTKWFSFKNGFSWEKRHGIDITTRCDDDDDDDDRRRIKRFSNQERIIKGIAQQCKNEEVIWIWVKVLLTARNEYFPGIEIRHMNCGNAFDACSVFTKYPGLTEMQAHVKTISAINAGDGSFENFFINFCFPDVGKENVILTDIEKYRGVLQMSAAKASEELPPCDAMLCFNPNTRAKGYGDIVKNFRCKYFIFYGEPCEYGECNPGNEFLQQFKDSQFQLVAKMFVYEGPLGPEGFFIYEKKDNKKDICYFYWDVHYSLFEISEFIYNNDAMRELFISCCGNIPLFAEQLAALCQKEEKA